ncbi:putative membrane protein [Friedmanniella endophytica]|uniref:Putative membrane protein n=1 Tax=Microlunatus kandeliicorticis TaxID=1759536 RepID=A0A7W3P4Y1_9ACTN|nr:vitamin K epoxide reductase family protein [Microlunatus kandeliicorticis]MBA8793379.1 putative membrane protein [Microlunatus kandeliicorticis]
MSTRTSATTGAAVARDGSAARRWLTAPFLLSVVGLAISVYLTVEHFTTPAILACPEGATVNCAKVTSSPYATLFGVPVAVLGLVFFVAMTALTVPAAWRVPALTWVRVGACAVGVVMVLYLVWVELFRVNAICLWCTGVHVVTVALLVAVLWRMTSRPVDQD